MNNIAYKSGYKYQLKEMYRITIDIKPVSPINTDYIQLDTDGNLTISKGYAWDGPSGPTIDTLSFMRASLVHDAFYQLMREGCLDHKIYRDPSDRLLQKMCIEDGMWRLRAWWVYQGVRLFADFAADPSESKPVTRAPGG
jgi:hypothetical protein